MSFTNVSVVVVALVALSVASTASVGALEVATPQEKAFVVTYGPPTGTRTVCVVCAQPVVTPPRTGNATEVMPEPVSVTVSWSWKLPAAAPL